MDELPPKKQNLRGPRKEGGTYLTFAEQSRLSDLLSDDETAIVKARRIFLKPFGDEAFVGLREKMRHRAVPRSSLGYWHSAALGNARAK